MRLAFHCYTLNNACKHLVLLHLPKFPTVYTKIIHKLIIPSYIYIIFENAQESLICIPLHTVVIGLEKTKYTVSEGNATILTVNVLEGAITQSVVVQISTNDGTAIGKYVHIILFFYVNGLSAVFDRTCTGP